MNYSRILVLTKVGSDARATFAALRFYAPSAAKVTVLAQQPAHQVAWTTPSAPPDDNEAMIGALDRLRSSAESSAPEVDIRLAPPTLTVDEFTDLVASTGADLVAVDWQAHDSIPLVADVRKRTSVAVLYVPDDTAPTRLAGRLLCVALSPRERWAVAAFLNAHTGAHDRAVLLSPTLLSAEEVRQICDVTGLTLEVEIVPGTPSTVRRLLAEDSGTAAHLIVLPRFPPAFLLPKRRGHPVLVLPSLRGTRAGAKAARTIDVPDLVDDGETIRVRAEYVIGVGRRTPIADQELAFVREGSVVARAFTHDGECELASPLGESVGIFRAANGGGAGGLTSIETQVRVLGPDARPRLLFDAELMPDELRIVRDVTWAEPVAVRIRSILSCRSLRARLRAAGLTPIVIDAATVLDEGDNRDVSPLVDAVRLARTAARLRARGFGIVAIVYGGSHQPSTVRFPALRPRELPTFAPPQAGASCDVRGATDGATCRVRSAHFASQLDMTTGSEAIAGNRIEVELDNPKARNWLLDAINSSHERVHFQVYMAADDDVGRPVEAALAAAAARGVTVRVLVDSLHGLHGSFGLHNPILDRLSLRPGVELRLGKPITRESPLEDLKQRDHRKLVVVDGRVALLGGRNLSHEYYSGFDEVPLNPGMMWRMVPWLDAGARVEGPAVAALERSFLQAWQDAGGAAFDIPACAPAGTATARVIVHQGLRDAHTVDAYIALIDSARSHVYVVNGFPLLLEIQHALLRALTRGVQVRTLVGNLTPRHAEGPFEGPWANVRTAWTSFVHSRMDPLVAAGGECYEFVVPHLPGWDPAVGDLRPHVHAKTMSVDGRVCAVGSANFDVTAGYWESELVLVVEDEGIAAGVEARFDELLATSRRIDADPDWPHRADLRRWMRYWPGVLSG
jgi:phosphatidylserine/phosphatidylglycerophosphate/cardiolipin synthase-like enzyme